MAVAHCYGLFTKYLAVDTVPLYQGRGAIFNLRDHAAFNAMTAGSEGKAQGNGDVPSIGPLPVPYPGGSSIWCNGAGFFYVPVWRARFVVMTGRPCSEQGAGGDRLRGACGSRLDPGWTVLLDQKSAQAVGTGSECCWRRFLARGGFSWHEKACARPIVDLRFFGKFLVGSVGWCSAPSPGPVQLNTPFYTHVLNYRRRSGGDFSRASLLTWCCRGERRFTTAV